MSLNPEVLKAETGGKEHFAKMKQQLGDPDRRHLEAWTPLEGYFYLP